MDEDQRKEEIKNLIYNYLTDGMFKKDAALMVGIDESTFYRWMQSDASFASRVEASILEYKHTLIRNVNACAIKDGKLALEILKRRFPSDWNVKSNEEVDNSETSTREVAELLQKILHKEDGHVTANTDLISSDSSSGAELPVLSS